METDSGTVETIVEVKEAVRSFFKSKFSETKENIPSLEIGMVTERIGDDFYLPKTQT